MGWSMKQAAEKTGIPADTLRYYDKEGIVSPRRRANGYRDYDEADITSLKNIVVMKYAHFSLGEMKRMEELFVREPSRECAEICREILRAKIAELKQAIGSYKKIANLMEELLLMINGASDYRDSEKRVDAFISQIFDDIQPRPNGKEG